MIACRALAVLAAVLFVVSVALATVGPGTPSLGAVVGWIRPNAVNTLRDWFLATLGPWSWNQVAQPLLIRPAWLPFASLGLILSGIAVSLSGRDASRRSHRRS